MPTISEIIKCLEAWAPPALQESYDNVGLLVGDANLPCTGVLCCLDITPEVVEEARTQQCNCIVAHHPLIFKPLKRIGNRTQQEQCITALIKNDIAAYALHTNLDNTFTGVNTFLADALGLQVEGRSILSTKSASLVKLTTYVPNEAVEAVRQALFEAGAGAIGNYRECSFESEGRGGFRPLENANPAIGEAGGNRETVVETKLEVVLPYYLEAAVARALHRAHPYETPAYEMVTINNANPELGSGLVGDLPKPIAPPEFLQWVKQHLGLRMLRYTPGKAERISRVAICGGAGSFLVKQAVAAGADAFITGDLKYHEFFDAQGAIWLADVGHFESERYTIDGVFSYLQQNFPTFAVLKTKIDTNPVHYFVG